MTLSAYLADFRIGWRALVAASLGLGSGLALLPFVINILAPHIVAEFGWSKSDFALASMVSGLTVLTYPIAGRLADRFGARRIAGAGILSTTAGYSALAFLDGPISHYVGVMVLQLTLGAMISGPVLLRLIVDNFERSRGMALAIAVSAPAVFAALASPLLSSLVEAQGWRTGSLAVAAFVAVLGSLAVMVIPNGSSGASNERRARATCGQTTNVRSLIGQPKFRLLMLMTLLVSMPLILSNSQLALVLVENGMSAGAAGGVIAFFAAGTIGGRLAAGVALDRFPAEKVGAIVLSLPAAGMLLLASPFDQAGVLAIAVLAVGIAFGAEGDILAYVASKHFELASYGAVLGILFGIAGASGMIGAFVLGRTLQAFNSYDAFLVFGSASVLVGSALLFRMAAPAGAAMGGAARADELFRNTR
jgi:MFS family permease